MNSWYVDSCRCGQGLLLVAKAKSDGSLILVCEDCCYVWDSPQSFYLKKPPIGDRFNIEIQDEILIEEIIEAAWDKYVKNIDNPIDI